MITKTIIYDIWKENKLKFPETINKFGIDKLENIFDNIIDFILSLDYLPHKILFTLTPEPDLGLWFNLQWFDLNLIIKQDIISEELNTNIKIIIKDSEENSYGNWESIKNEIKIINQDLIKIKSEL